MSDEKNYLDMDDEEEIPIFSDEDLIVIENKSPSPIKDIEEEGEMEEESNDDISDELEDLEEGELEIELEDDLEDSGNYITDDNPLEVEENVDFDLIYRLNTNKHRQEGKHTLQRDTIFKGKLDEKIELNEDGYSGTDNSHADTFKLFDVEFDSYTDDYLNQNNLTKDVFNILETKTDLDFRQNRRKPNKETFNNYYNLLLKELGFRYTKSEIFVELSYYFTDNIFNMFKLLDKRPATIIIKELMQKGYLKNINGIDFL
jgi:hypothetical protein